MNRLLLVASLLLAAFALSTNAAEQNKNITQEARTDNWKYYRNYINKYGSSSEKSKPSIDSLYSYCKKSGTIEAIDYGIKHLGAADRQRFLMLMHDVYAHSFMHSYFGGFSIDGFADNLNQFYTDYKDYGANDLSVKSKDDAFINNHSSWNGDELIKKTAPYSVAYFNLTYLIKDNVKNKNWAAAIRTVNSYATYFGDDQDYKMLRQTLNANFNNTIKATRMNANINFEEGSQYAPCISADGKSILFCARHRKDNKGGEDIFISNLNKEGWTKSGLVKDLNTEEGNEAPSAISADGTKMIMFKTGTLYLSEKTKDGWSKPKTLPSSINGADWQADAMITSDGKAMLFSAKKQSDQELEPSINIFVSLLDENGEWGEPIDLGKTINTAFTDRSPFLHPDMKTLYFCSEGHGSLGGLDVFKTTRLYDDSWTDWSEPVNLGKEINTISDDWGYRISTDGKTAFFAKIIKELNNKERIFYVNLPKSMRPQPVATITGKLKDTEGNPIHASIDWEDLETHQQVGQSETDPEDGSYFIVLPEGKNYGYYVSDTTFFPVANNIDLRGKDELMQIEHPIEVVSIEKMKESSIPMILNNIFFKTDKYELLPASINELQRVAVLIKKVGRKVEISGHTDDVSTAEYNQELSEKRANAVRDYLIGQGISADLLVAKGYGMSKPVTNSKTAAGRQQNRRVEMRFLK